MAPCPLNSVILHRVLQKTKSETAPQIVAARFFAIRTGYRVFWTCIARLTPPASLDRDVTNYFKAWRLGWLLVFQPPLWQARWCW